MRTWLSRIRGIVGPGFFEATGVRVILGRSFEPTDEQSPVRVAVVNQAMARRFFGQAPVGRRFTIPNRYPNDTFEIVGVAEDSSYRRLRQEAQEATITFYLPAFQDPGASMAGQMRDVAVELRTASAGPALESMIRGVVREADPAGAVT